MVHTQVHTNYCIRKFPRRSFYPVTPIFKCASREIVTNGLITICNLSHKIHIWIKKHHMKMFYRLDTFECIPVLEPYHLCTKSSGGKQASNQIEIWVRDVGGRGKTWARSKLTFSGGMAPQNVLST